MILSEEIIENAYSLLARQEILLANPLYDHESYLEYQDELLSRMENVEESTLDHIYSKGGARGKKLRRKRRRLPGWW